MLNTLPGCASVNGQSVSLLEAGVYAVGGFLRAATLVIGDFAILGVTWVLDKITWPFYPLTGFNMDKPAGFLFQTWHKLIDPNKVHSDWSSMGDAEFHEEHPLTIWEKLQGKTRKDEDIQIQATEDPTEPCPDEDIQATGETLIQTDNKTITITYDATGGDGAPEDQIIYTSVDTTVFEDFSFRAVGSLCSSAWDVYLGQKISNTIPTRSGYHFVGWTDSYNPEDDGLWHYDENGIPRYSLPGNIVKYYPGKKITYATEEMFTQDVTLYAVWQKPEYGWDVKVHRNYHELSTYHKLEIKRENDDKTIRIFCKECGFELIDRDISPEDFLYIWCDNKEQSFNSLSKRKQKKCNREYILYRTQDFAPLALSLIGSFYDNIGKEIEINESSLSEQEKQKAAEASRMKALDGFGDFGEMLEFAADFDLKYANSQYAKEPTYFVPDQYEHYNGYTTAYLLREQKPEDKDALLRQSKAKFFKTAENIGKGMTYGVAFAQATFYGYDAFTSDELASGKTVKLVKGIHTIVNLCPYVGDYYDKLLIVLEEGLELYDACVKEKNGYYTFLDQIMKDDQYTIPGTKLNMIDIDQARNNIFQPNDFNKNGGPSVISVLEWLLSEPLGTGINTYSSLSLEDKTLAVWYLSMRLEYDFQKEFGITLQQYIEYFKGNEEAEILKELMDCM